jgi:hypothetical protein
MNQPTDRMLIDALCILAADRMDPVDLNHEGERAKIVHRAREIIAHYAPMAIARIMRERDLAEPEEVEPTPLGSPRQMLAVTLDWRDSEVIGGAFTTDDESLIKVCAEAHHLCTLIPANTLKPLVGEAWKGPTGDAVYRIEIMQSEIDDAVTFRFRRQ